MVSSSCASARVPNVAMESTCVCPLVNIPEP